MASVWLNKYMSQEFRGEMTPGHGHEGVNGRGLIFDVIRWVEVILRHLGEKKRSNPGPRLETILHRETGKWQQS